MVMEPCGTPSSGSVMRCAAPPSATSLSSTVLYCRPAHF